MPSLKSTLNSSINLGNKGRQVALRAGDSNSNPAKIKIYSNRYNV
jgi:hypothetical protein